MNHLLITMTVQYFAEFAFREKPPLVLFSFRGMQKWDIFYHYGGVIYQTEGDAWHCSKALVETEKSDKTVVYDVIL